MHAAIAGCSERFELKGPAATYKPEKAFLFNDLPQPCRRIGDGTSAMNPIRSMIGEDKARFLYWLAENCYSGAGAILDLGPLAAGLPTL